MRVASCKCKRFLFNLSDGQCTTVTVYEGCTCENRPEKVLTYRVFRMDVYTTTTKLSSRRGRAAPSRVRLVVDVTPLHEEKGECTRTRALLRVPFLFLSIQHIRCSARGFLETAQKSVCYAWILFTGTYSGHSKTPAYVVNRF